MVRRRKRDVRGQQELWPQAAQRAEASPARSAVLSGEWWRGKRVHFVGIGGIGMSGIAKLLHHEGCAVSGCDAAESTVTASLVKEGIPVWTGHSPEHLAGEVDAVVVSAAIRETNPECRAAERMGIEVLRYAQVLGMLMKDREGIAVSGSHGKTTTTSMIAYTLDRAGQDPSMLIGGMVPQLGGNARNGGKGPFVVEACEYDRSFLNLTPKAGVITNIDNTHPDYYSDMGELTEAFGAFAGRVRADGIVVANGDDPNAVRAASRSSALVETFGQGRGCTWRIGGWSRAEGLTRFTAHYHGRDLEAFELRVPGLYNIRNALACVGVCRFFGVEMEAVRSALAEFRGAERRFHCLGEAGGVMVMDDYGHHPTEVKVTLDAARQEFPERRLWCVFQPHQYSRTRILLKEFGESFGSADRVIVPDIHSVRDTARDRASVHSRDLVRQIRRNGVEAEYGSRFPQIVRRLLSGVRRGDLVMTMGAGPVDDVGWKLLAALRERER